MSEVSTDRRDPVYAALDEAANTVLELDDEARASEGFGIVQRTLAYARLAVEQSDPELLTDSALATLQASATALAANAPTAVANPRSYLDPILVVLPAFPAPQGRDMEQAARDAAAAFQKSANDARGNLSATLRRRRV
jgi:hypothetical protein